MNAVRKKQRKLTVFWGYVFVWVWWGGKVPFFDHFFLNYITDHIWNLIFYFLQTIHQHLGNVPNGTHVSHFNQ